MKSRTLNVSAQLHSIRRILFALNSFCISKINQYTDLKNALTYCLNAVLNSEPDVQECDATTA